MRKLIFKYVWVTLVGLVASVPVALFSGHSTYALEWPITSQSFPIDYQDETDPCLGWTQQVTLSGEGVVQACVSGDSVKLAQYYPINGGGMRYAIQFQSDPLFYGLDACDVYGCSLSSNGETFVELQWISSTGRRAQVYKNFITSITPYIPASGAGKRYRIPPRPDIVIEHPNNSPLFAVSSAVSNNGRWAAIELKSYGTVLVDTKTLDVRRIIAPGATYGLTSDPKVEMAISNDGSQLVVMGYRTAATLVQIDAVCGDRLTLTSEYAYQGAITPCSSKNLEANAHIANYAWAGHPVFAMGDDALSFVVYNRQSEARKVIVRGSGFPVSPVVQVMAVGDSFTSGEGETDDVFYIGALESKCHTSRRSYPYLVGRVWGVATLNTACSGAVIDDVLEDGKKGGAQIKSVFHAQPRVVFIGIGGNDAGLMGKLSACVALDTCEWAKTSDARARAAKEIKALYPRLRSLYSQIRLASGAEPLVVGYPYIINVDDCRDGAGVLFDAEERRFMQEALKYLNAVIKRAAHDSGIRFVDMSEAFQSNKLCDATETPAMNAIRFGDDIAPIKIFPAVKVIGAESFHPTPFGHELMSRQITTRNSTMYSIESCSDCTYIGAAPQPSVYWGEASDIASVRIQQRREFAQKKELSDEYEISLADGSFKPFQQVAIEIHSDPVSLGVVQSSATGGVATTVVLPKNIEPGVHSIHTFGTSLSGEPVEYYDFVSVVADPQGVAYTQSNQLPSASKVESAEQVNIKSAELLQQDSEARLVLGRETTVANGVSQKTNHINARNVPVNISSMLTIIALTLTVLNVAYFIYSRRKMSKEPGG